MIARPTVLNVRRQGAPFTLDRDLDVGALASHAGQSTGYSLNMGLRVSCTSFQPDPISGPLALGSRNI